MAIQTQPKKNFSFRPSNDVRERLENLSEKTDRPISFYINTILEQHIAEIEHAYLLQATLEDVRTGKTETYSLDEVAEELGL